MTREETEKRAVSKKLGNVNAHNALVREWRYKNEEMRSVVFTNALKLSKVHRMMRFVIRLHIFADK